MDKPTMRSPFKRLDADPKELVFDACELAFRKCHSRSFDKNRHAAPMLAKGYLKKPELDKAVDELLSEWYAAKEKDPNYKPSR